MVHDNPASRLHAILAAGTKRESGKQCAMVWADLLGVPSSDSNALLSAIGKVMSLPSEIVALTDQHFPNLTPLSAIWRAPLENAFFNQKLGGGWETFSQQVSAACIGQLATLGELLHTKIGADLAEDNSVAELSAGLSELISTVETCDLPADLRLYLINELISLKLALAEYRIVGSAAALRQAEAVIGHTARDSRLKDFLLSHEVGKRVLDNLNAVVGILTTVVLASQIAAPTFSLLPAP